MAFLAEFKKKYGQHVNEEDAVKKVWLNGMRGRDERNEALESALRKKYQASLSDYNPRPLTAALPYIPVGYYDNNPQYNEFKAAELAQLQIRFHIKKAEDEVRLSIMKRMPNANKQTIEDEINRTIYHMQADGDLDYPDNPNPKAALYDKALMDIMSRSGASNDLAGRLPPLSPLANGALRPPISGATDAPNLPLRSKVLAAQRSATSALDLAGRLPVPPLSPLANGALRTPISDATDAPNLPLRSKVLAAQRSATSALDLAGRLPVPRRQLTNAELASREANPPVAVVAPRRPAMSSNAFLAAQRSASNAANAPKTVVGTESQRKRALAQLAHLKRPPTDVELNAEIKKVIRFNQTQAARRKGGAKKRKTRRN